MVTQFAVIPGTNIPLGTGAAAAVVQGRVPFNPAPGSGGTRTVRSGDTLGAIASSAGLSLSELLSLPGNDVFRDNPDLIHPGQVVITGQVARSVPSSPVTRTPTPSRGPDPQPIPGVDPATGNLRLFVPPAGGTFITTPTLSGPNRDIEPTPFAGTDSNDGGDGGFFDFIAGIPIPGGNIGEGLSATGDLFGAAGGGIADAAGAAGGGLADLGGGIADALDDPLAGLGDALNEFAGGLQDFSSGLGDFAGGIGGGLIGTLNAIPITVWLLLAGIAAILIVGFQSGGLSASVSQ